MTASSNTSALGRRRLILSRCAPGLRTVQLDNTASHVLGDVIRYISMSLPHFEALQTTADSHNIPAFTQVVDVIIATHQPDNTFITAETLRRAVANRLKIYNEAHT